MTGIEAELDFLKLQMMSEAAGNYGASAVMAGGEAQAQSLSRADSDHLQLMKDSDVTAAADDAGASFHVSSPSAHPFPAFPQQSLSSPMAANAVLGIDSQRSISPAASPPALAAPTQPQSIERAQSSAKPRTLAGFIVDDEDDRNDLPQQPGDVALLCLSETVPGGSSNGVPARVPRSTSKSPSQAASSSVLPESSSTFPAAAAAAAAAASAAQNSSPVPPNDNPSMVAPPASSQAASKHGSPAPAGAAPASSDTEKAPVTITKARLPQDRVGMLEDRIKDDTRGDLDAWTSLIAEHRRRNKFQDARAVYERFFKVFPMAAEMWVAYANMELNNNDFYRVEQIFNKSLLNLPSLQLWSLYLDYLRRRNNLTMDTSGSARAVLSQAYELVLKNVGIDKDSGRIWQDYVQFLRSGPGIVGGSNWQDQQKMDQLRKAYQRAICIPTAAVNTLWKEYDSFEMGLNKITGRKFLQEKSPSYMTARSSFTELENITRGLHRTTLPVLPPALGFEGDEEYLSQVALWKKWIQWEKDDPLVLKDEDSAAYKGRVVYAFKQATMALRFWPEIWFDAAEFCFQNDLEKEGNDFLEHGIAANPESSLLAFKRADRIESALSTDESEEGLRRRGAAIREPYDRLLDALYELVTKTKAREAQDIARVEENFAKKRADSASREQHTRFDDDDDYQVEEMEAREAAKQAQIKIAQDGSASQIRILSKAISFAWINLMRAMRRVQGKGKVGDVIGGARQIFTDARKRGRLTSDVYVASALIEYHCYKDPAATKIFERGMKLFPEDETFALEYLKHLIAINDITNARAVFETTVSRLGQKPELLPKAKPIYAFFHEYESQYGELLQISKLERRMAALFPDDPKLSHFSRRFASRGFDPTALRPIISPATQTRPKSAAGTAAGTAAGKGPAGQKPSPQLPPRPQVERPASPKRSYPTDDGDYDNGGRRKLARGDSPLKGAAGRRMDQQKRNMQHTHQHQQHQHQNAQNQHHHFHQQHTQQQGHGYQQQQQQRYPQHDAYSQSNYGGGAPLAPASLPRDVLFLLGIIPPAETYYPTPRLRPDAMVRLLRDQPLAAQGMPAARPAGPSGSSSYAQGVSYASLSRDPHRSGSPYPSRRHYK